LYFSKALYLRERLEEIGFSVPFKGKHLWEFPVKHKEVKKAYERAKEEGIVFGVPLWKYDEYEDTLLVSVTEKRKKEEIDRPCKDR